MIDLQKGTDLQNQVGISLKPMDEYACMCAYTAIFHIIGKKKNNHGK